MPNFYTVPIYRQGRTYHVPPPGQGGVGPKIVLGCFFFFFLIGVPAGLYVVEKQFHDDLEAFHEVEDEVVELRDAKGSQKRRIVHLQSSNFSVSAQDWDFGISLEGALSLERVTEYCQWVEHSSSSCRQCPDREGDGTHDCDCTKTYNYVKQWHYHRYNSVLFDQPAAHWNPQRDPYPSTTLLADSVRATDDDTGTVAILDKALLSGRSIRATSRSVDWTLGALPAPSLFASFLGLFGWQDKTRYEEIRRMQRWVLKSPAYLGEDKFVYIGQGGYFFSRYEGTNMGQLFNYFAQYLEGSLLDFQGGDVIDWLGFGCQAGDIRVRFRVQDPPRISVVAGLGHWLPDGSDAERRMDRDGKAYTFPEVTQWYADHYSADQIKSYWESSMQKSSDPVLGVYRTPKGNRIAMVHEGFKSALEMFKAVLSSDFWGAIGARVMLMPWAYVVGSYLMLPPWVGGSTAPLWQGNAPGWAKLPGRHAAAGVYFLALGVMWVLTWGLEIDLDWHDLLTPVVLIVGLVLFGLSCADPEDVKRWMDKAKKM